MFTGIIVIITICLISIVLYYAISFVGNIRGGTTTEDIKTEKPFVEGFKDIPIYPHSQFIYENQENEILVQNMLSKGISAYRIPRGTRSNDIYTYYEENLKEYGWEYVFTKTTSLNENLFGQYWYKEKNGLRIYVENNDIWYEKISVDEAKSGLRNRREQEIERTEIFKSSEEQLLLPHYPWYLKIPNEYIIKYSQSNIEDLEKIEMQKEENKYFIEPIEKGIGDNFDEYLEYFANDKEWKITQRQNKLINDKKGYYFHYKTNKEIGEGYLIQNNIDYLIYAIFTNTIDDDFFEYITLNIIEP